MHFYPHNIADFNNSTRHLTRVERSVYRDAIELYYDTEQPLPGDDFAWLAKRLLCHSEEEKNALQSILGEFFVPEGECYRHERCDLEIEKYRANVSAKARAGKASAEARRQKNKGGPKKGKQQDTTSVEQVLNTRGTDEQQNNNHKPITNNQEPKERGVSRKRFTPPTAAEVVAYAVERNATNFDPHRFLDYYQAQGWKLANGRPMADWKAAVRTWLSRDSDNATNRPAGSPAETGRKLTPAERVEQARLAAAERQAGNTH